MSNIGYKKLSLTADNAQITDDARTVLKTYIDNMNTQFFFGKDSYVNKKDVSANEARSQFITEILTKNFDDDAKKFTGVVDLDNIKNELFVENGFNFIINNINTTAYQIGVNGKDKTLLNLIYNDQDKSFSFNEEAQGPANTVNAGVEELRPNIFKYGEQGIPKRCVYGQMYDCAVKPNDNTPKSQCVLDVSGYVLYDFVHNYKKYSGNAKHNLKKLLEKNIMDLFDYKCEHLEKKINDLFTFTLYDILCDGAFFIYEHENVYTCLPLDRILCHYNTDPTLMHLKKNGEEDIITQDSKFTLTEFIQDIFGMKKDDINDEIIDLFISCLHKKLIYMFRNFNFNSSNSDLSIIVSDIFAMFAFFVKLNHEIQDNNRIKNCLSIEVYKSINVKKKLVGDISDNQDYNINNVFVSKIGAPDNIDTRFNGRNKLPFYPFINTDENSDYTSQGIRFNINNSVDIAKQFNEIFITNKTGIYNGNYTFSNDSKLNKIIEYDLLLYCIKLLNLLKTNKWFYELNIGDGRIKADSLQDLAYPFSLISSMPAAANRDWTDNYYKNFLLFNLDAIITTIDNKITALATGGINNGHKNNLKLFIRHLIKSGKIYSFILKSQTVDEFKNIMLDAAATETVKGVQDKGNAAYLNNAVSELSNTIYTDPEIKDPITDISNFQNLYSSILNTEKISVISFNNAVFMYYILSSVLCASFMHGEQVKTIISKYFALVIKNAYAQKYLLDNFIKQDSSIKKYFNTEFNYNTKFFDTISLFNYQGIQNTNEMYEYIFYNILSSYSTAQDVGKLRLYDYKDDKNPISLPSENIFRTLMDNINQSRTINHKVDLSTKYKYSLNDKDIMMYIYDLTKYNKTIPESYGRQEQPKKRAEFGEDEKASLTKIFSSLVSKGNYDDKTMEYYNNVFNIDAPKPSKVKQEKEDKHKQNPFNGMLYDDKERFTGGADVNQTVNYNISDDLYVLLLLNKYGLMDQKKLKYFYLIQALLSGEILRMDLINASNFVGDNHLKLKYSVDVNKINLFNKSRESDVQNALKQLEKQVFYYFYGYNKQTFSKYKIEFGGAAGACKDILSVQNIPDYNTDYIEYANIRTKEIMNIPANANNIPKTKYNSGINAMNQNNTGIYGLTSLDDTSFNFINSKPSYESQLGNLGVIPYLVSRGKKMIGGNPDLYGMTLSKIAQVRDKDRKTIEQLYKDNKLNATQNTLIDEAEKLTKLNDERIKIFTEILGLISKYMEKHKDDKTIKDTGITIEKLASIVDDKQTGGSYNIDDLMKKLKRLEYNRQQSTNEFIDKLNNAKFD